MAESIEMQRSGAGFAQFRAWLRRVSRRAPAAYTATPIATTDKSRDHLLPGESAAAWITTHSELGEMAGVAIEMLDLSRRWRRRD